MKEGLKMHLSIKIILIFMSVIILASIFCICCSNKKINRDIKITSKEDMYCVHIVDEGVMFLPVDVKIWFKVDDNNILIPDSVDYEYNKRWNMDYTSVVPYVNSESSNTVFVWFWIDNIEIYNMSGEIIDRKEFEYEIMFRINLDALEVYDI